MFSHEQSSDWFFLNDFRVFKGNFHPKFYVTCLEILIRELQDLPQHDKKLIEYLDLLHSALKNHPSADEKLHRIEEIAAIINAFLSLDVYPATDPVYILAEKIYINIIS
jgi:hypothetical protein